MDHRTFIIPKIDHCKMKPTRLEPGDVIVAKVKTIEHFGVFFDYDDIRILVLINEMINGIFDHPSNLVSEGERIRLKILSFNELDNAYNATMKI